MAAVTATDATLFVPILLTMNVYAHFCIVHNDIVYGYARASFNVYGIFKRALLQKKNLNHLDGKEEKRIRKYSRAYTNRQSDRQTDIQAEQE